MCDGWNAIFDSCQSMQTLHCTIYWLKMDITGNHTEWNRISHSMLWAAKFAIRLWTIFLSSILRHGPHWCYDSFKWSRFGVDSMITGSEFTGQCTQMRTLQPSNGFEWEKWRSRGRISMVCILQVIFLSAIVLEVFFSAPSFIVFHSHIYKCSRICVYNVYV